MSRWMEALGLCVAQGSQMGAFAISQGMLVLTDHGAFQQRMKQRWEIQWKHHLVKDMMAPWLVVCNSARELESMLALPPHETNGGAGVAKSCPSGQDTSFWLLDSQRCVDHVRHPSSATGTRTTTTLLPRRIAVTAHAQRHDLHSIYVWHDRSWRCVVLQDEPDDVACWALDAAISVLSAMHMCFVRDFLGRSASAIADSRTACVSDTHPLAPALDFLVGRMHALVTGQSTSHHQPLKHHNQISMPFTISRHVWHEQSLDVRQRASRAIGVSDIAARQDASLRYRTFATHAKVLDERRRRESLQETLMQQSKDKALVPFVRYVAAMDRLRDDKAAQRLRESDRVGPGSPTHALLHTQFARRCNVEESLLQHLNQLRMNTYENIELRNWSERVKRLMPIGTLLLADPTRACPYRTLALLADLVCALIEHHVQVSQFHPTHHAHVQDDNLFDAVTRIQAWVESRTTSATTQTTSPMPELFQQLLDVLHQSSPAHAFAKTGDSDSHAQPASSHPQHVTSY